METLYPALLLAGPYCWLLLVGALLGRLSWNQAVPKEMKLGSMVLQAPPEGSYRVTWDLQRCTWVLSMAARVRSTLGSLPSGAAVQLMDSGMDNGWQADTLRSGSEDGWFSLRCI